MSPNESFVSLRKSLDDFKKIQRRPTECHPADAHGQVQFINVYSNKTITNPSSLCIYKSHTEPTLGAQSPVTPYRSFASQSCLSNHKTFKLLPKVVASQKEFIITQKIENKKPTRIGIENLINPSKKESIIFNQVKNLAIDKPKVIAHEQGRKEAVLVKTKSKRKNLMRLSTLRMAQFVEQQAINLKNKEKEKGKGKEKEKETEEDLNLKSKEKRKPLKMKEWKWVGSEGEMIY